jgi:WD40 repeat protein
LKALTGEAPLPIAELATQVIHGLSAMRLKSIGAVLLLFSVVGSGAGLLAHHRRALPAAPTPQASPASSGKVETPPRTDLYGDPLPPGAVARMGTIRLRGASERVTFSPDGKQVISTDWLSIRTWETATGKPLKRTPLQTTEAQGIPRFDECLLTADGKTLVAAAKDTLYIWDAATGRERRRISEEKLFAHALAVSPDGRTLAVGTFTRRPGNPIRLWDTKTGEAKPPLRGHDEGIIALEFSPDGKTLASSSWDGTVRLWDPATDEQVHKLRLTDPFRSLPVMTNHLAFSPDGKLLAAGNYAKSVKLWDVKTGEEKGTLEVPAARTIVSVTFSPDSKTLAAGGNGDVALFDVTTRKQLRHWPVGFSGLFRFSPDGKLLASCRAGTIRLWDIASGKRTLSWPGHTNPVEWLGALTDGKTLASAARTENQIIFWDFSTGKLLRTLQAKPSSDLYSRSLSADGKYLVAGGADGTARVWELPNGKEVRQLDFELEKGGQKPPIYVCQFSPDGKQLAAVGLVSDPGNKVHAHLMAWDVAANKRLVSRRMPDGLAGNMCRFTADGRTIIIPRVDGLALKDVLTDEERLTIPGDAGPPMISSPDGRVLAAAIYKPRPAGDRGAYRDPQEVESVGFWELATGQCIGRLKTGIAAEIAFSPEGQLVAVAGTDALSLWDVATGKRVLRQPIEQINSRFYSSAVRSLAFSRDGQTLATGLTDSTILVWDVSAAREAISRPHELDDKELDRAWTDLAGEASAAWPTIGTLTAAAPQTLALFKERLRPAASPSAKHLRRLLTELDNPDFTIRTDAAHELEKFGDLAAPALRRALEDKPSLEVRRRIESVLAAGRFVRQPEALRRLRAIRVLEQIGTPEAQRMLRKLADGDPSARETAAARDAWTRSQRQAKP